MSSDIDICNLALAHIGDTAQVSSITGADASVQAAHCARYYPMARDYILSRAAWRFATTTVALAPSSTSPTALWAYSYDLPTDLLRPVRLVLSANSSTSNDSGDNDPVGRIPFEIARVGAFQILMTNDPTGMLEYAYRETDTTRYSVGVVMAISYQLASYLAGPIIKGKAALQIAQGMRMQASVEWANAAVTDALGYRLERHANYVASSVRARA